MPRTRERQLAKLAARRAAERRKRRRQRLAAGVLGGLMALGGVGFAGWALFIREEPADPAARRTPPDGTGGAACGGSVPDTASQPKQSYEQPPEMQIDPGQRYEVTMATSCGRMVIELDPTLGAETVNSIVFLTREGFYDGLTFHRIARDFVIQGGDPNGDGTGGPGYQTVNAPPEGFTYEPGMVAMAKGGAEPAGTSGSQFFVVTGDPAPLNASPIYAVIGRVVEGMDVADRIAALEIQGGTTDGPPVQTVYIESATVEPVA